jgi:hypothetical protein
MQATSVIDLAREAADCFEWAARDLEGQKDPQPFLRVRDGAPEWVTDLVRVAHDGILPDDWRYARIRDALVFIAEDTEDPEDDVHGFADSACDAYNSDLCAWLGSSAYRPGYCDEAVKEFGYSDGGIMRMVQMGQYMEAAEIYGLVLHGLESLTRP